MLVARLSAEPPAEFIYECGQIVWGMIAAPGNVLIRTNQNEPLSIDIRRGLRG